MSQQSRDVPGRSLSTAPDDIVRPSRRARTWGRRPYGSKEAREILNDVSAAIARDRPDHVDDPTDPTLAEVLRSHYDAETKAATLTALLRDGLSFQEAVCAYFYWFSGFDLVEIHFAQEGISRGGDPTQLRNSLRNIKRVLTSAAEQLDADVTPPDEDTV